eukprot:4297146-Amphidinium_carterae.1
MKTNIGIQNETQTHTTRVAKPVPRFVTSSKNPHFVIIPPGLVDFWGGGLAYKSWRWVRSLNYLRNHMCCGALQRRSKIANASTVDLFAGIFALSKVRLARANLKQWCEGPRLGL